MLVPEKTCNELNDQEIIRRSLETVDYFSCLYERYEARLLSYIKRITHCDHAEAEDILQEAFIKIWRNLHAYNPELKLSSWIYRIVHNQAISTLRKNSSFGKDHKIEWDETLPAGLADKTPSFAEPEEEIDIHMIADTLNLLPLPYREVLVLRFMEDLSYEEISDVLKIPEGTVATRINRAKKAFAKTSASNSFSKRFEP